MDCPCFKCTRRTPECHGVCVDYKEWDALKVKYKNKDAEYLSYMKDRSTKVLRDIKHGKRKY